jgi:hypothetical protein
VVETLVGASLERWARVASSNRREIQLFISVRRENGGSGSSPAKSYYKDPGESLTGATFHPKIANPGFVSDFLREIIACNLDARRQAVKTGRISRNKPGV